MTLKKFFIAALSTGFLAGCLANDKMKMVSTDESAIEFTNRLTVDFSNKLDKIINATMRSAVTDHGDYFSRKGWFTPLEAGIEGTRAAYDEFCAHKGATMELGVCSTDDGRVLFVAELSGRRGPNGNTIVDFNIMEAKVPGKAPVLQKKLLAAQSQAAWPTGTEMVARHSEVLKKRDLGRKVSQYGDSCLGSVGVILNNATASFATMGVPFTHSAQSKWKRDEDCATGGEMELSNAHSKCLDFKFNFGPNFRTTSNVTVCRSGEAPNDWAIQ